MSKEIQLDIKAIDKFAGKYALGYEKGEGSNHFLRIKVVGGELTIDQARTIAEISEKYGHGYLEITTRHDIQLHWIKDEDAPIIFAKLEEVGLNTDMCGQAYPEARYGDVRNIVTCPISGIQKGELFDTLPIVKEAVKFFTGKTEYLDLPRKFKIAVSACPLNCVRLEINDLGLVAIKSSYGLGFTAFIGGGIGVPPMLAKPMNIYIGLNEVLDFMKAIVEIYRDYGDRKSKAKARFKWMVEEFGIEKIIKLIEMKIGKQLKFFDTKNINLKWDDHIGYQQQKQEGFYFIVVPTLVGILNVKQFKKILELVDKYGGNRIRVSPLQKIILVDIPKDKLSIVIEELGNIGFTLNHPPIRWTTIACPANFCSKALENVKNRAIEIEEHLEKIFGIKLKELKLRIAISGCPNSCAHHKIAEIGLQATAIRKNGTLKPAYDIYLKSEFSNISQLFLKNVLAEDVKYEIEKLIKMYLETNFSNFHKFAEKCLEEKVTYGS